MLVHSVFLIFLLLLVFKDSLLTNAERCRRDFSEDPSCKFYGSVDESCIHVLRNCCKARKVWEQIILSRLLSQFFSYSLLD